jgi:hypothetical protein
MNGAPKAVCRQAGLNFVNLQRGTLEFGRLVSMGVRSAHSS